ncbi:alpha/beta fold hydrolase [Rheinheimera sp. WS51]|uniref:alpha/beta fold hydrolase n=1 Tax=Rheinheimera sp. WS51 TaxID=3425886 RepID=UPI003D8CA0FC
MKPHSPFPIIKPLSKAALLTEQWQKRVQPFWHKMPEGELISHDGTRLFYKYHHSPQAQCAVVISAGRMEMALKYAELSYELVQAGYSVFILDHRGQGLSQRSLGNKFKGDIIDFDLYQQDFNQFMLQIVQPRQHKYHIALGHSMGCAILATYLAKQPKHPFVATILAAPMFGIYTSIVPYPVAQFAVLAWYKVNRCFSTTPWYAPFQGDYRLKPFKNNPQTSNQERYLWLQQQYQQQPKSQLGGVTLRWLEQAIYAMENIHLQAAKWSTPVLLLQAAEDKVVANRSQDNWYQALPKNLNKQKVSIQGAKHEIFMEHDAIRDNAFNAINDFLQQVPFN